MIITKTKMLAFNKRSFKREPGFAIIYYIDEKRGAINSLMRAKVRR